MKNLKIIITICLLTSIGGFLRFYSFINNPPSLNIDEVAYGYSAYSVLKTGRDENNVFMPLAFRSTGDFKSPVLTYSLVPLISLFGLNEFSVRFTTALAGTFSIPAFFLLINTLLKNLKVSFIGTTLLTISPWHIFYSRFASESLMATFLLISGMWLFVRLLDGGKRIWGILAAFVLVLSMYSYHSHKIFIPIFVFVALFLYKKRLQFHGGITAFIIISFLMLTPLIYLSIFGGVNTRAKMVFIASDIDYTRYVILDHIQRYGEGFLLFFFWVKRYLNYFQVDFLFFNGLNMTQQGTLGLGVLYLFELPFLILGIIFLIRQKINKKGLLCFWIMLGLLPASLTNNEQSSVRSLLILPPLLVIISLGVDKFINLINNLRNIFVRLGFLTVFGFFILINLIQAFLVFAVHFPMQKGEAFMEGTKETILYALTNKDKYSEIVYDPYRGIEAPYIVNIPYMYILFYSSYNPAAYQTEKKIYGADYFHFDKFTIRKIDWRKDKNNKDILLIGSPWSLPQKDIREDQILKKVYLSNGNLALLIVSPKAEQ